VNFADASAKGGGSPGLIFRYGKAVGSIEMEQFAAYLYNREGGKTRVGTGRDLYRTFENLLSAKELSTVKPAVPNEPYCWYPETEFCYMRTSSGFFFASKGGYNNESHNHNDMGSFILYLNQTPMIIDAGVGTYTRQTFSNERYSIWTMQSNYHNLPLINGVAQSAGSEYRSADVLFKAKKSTFSLDLAGAYPKEAAVEKWNRSYQLDDNGLSVRDNFKLKKAVHANQLHFLIWAKPDLSVPGTVLVEKDGVKLKMSYNPAQFTPSVETIDLPDARLSRVWGEQVFRLSLKAKNKKISGSYQYTFEKL
jgi:hypothetical protein